LVASTHHKTSYSDLVMDTRCQVPDTPAGRYCEKLLDVSLGGNEVSLCPAISGALAGAHMHVESHPLLHACYFPSRPPLQPPIMSYYTNFSCFLLGAGSRIASFPFDTVQKVLYYFTIIYARRALTSFEVIQAHSIHSCSSVYSCRAQTYPWLNGELHSTLSCFKS
jgi:hypothetical protein